MNTVVTTIVNSDTSILWLIVLIPVFLSLILYLLAKCLASTKTSLDEEEESRLFHQNHPPTLTLAPPSPPPSYFASHRDRLYRIHEKPPDYVIVTSANDPEDMPLDEVKQIIMDQRQKR
ncbi:hypothetical protein BCR42DRAFT_436911 [Absidia repens]|uniref:Uncharacterized protein n=1 Tax=Absidia repens TaxID=90262 RepID=A0A1X2IKV0_9FUNG|nr:hypothetical protein BCR42DRAFT_436911 [Absidia repens]